MQKEKGYKIMAKLHGISQIDYLSVTDTVFQSGTVVDNSETPRPHYCIATIKSGTAVFANSATGEVIYVYPGEIIFVPKGSRYSSTWYSYDGKNAEYTSAHLSPAISNNIFSDAVFPLQKLSDPIAAKELGKIIGGDIKEEYFKENRDSMLLLSYIYKMLSLLLPALNKTPMPKIDERIKKATDYIESHFSEDIAVPALAEISGISISHFYTEFKTATGKTPIDYKNSVAINRAMTLLYDDKHLKIEEISDILGFYSSGYFRRVFKQVTGITPTEYRKQRKEL